MRRKYGLLAMQFAVVAALAAATPALAADGTTAVAMQTQTATMQTAIYQNDETGGAAMQPESTAVATHGPARLNVLVGNDQQAWASAHSVHVDFARRHPQ